MARRAQAPGTTHTLVRTSAAVLCGLLLSANLGNLLHLATHAHTYCAEHQEVVHAEATTAALLRPLAPTADHAREAMASARPATPAEHAHCAHAQLYARSAHLIARAPGASRVIATAPACAPPPGVATVLCAARCLRQAPKTSPPVG